MEQEFVPYKLTLKLKELGFDEPCFAWYVSENYGLVIGRVIKSNLIMDAVLAPTFSQAFRWLMQFPQIKKYRYNIALYPDGTYSLKDGKDSIYEYLSGDDCIDKLIEIVESRLD